MARRFLFAFVPLVVLVACSDPLPDIFDSPSVSAPLTSVAIGEATTIDVGAASGRTVSVDEFECVGCSARILSQSGLGARFEVSSSTAGTARLRLNLRNGEGRALVVERAITFAAPARIEGYRRFDDAKTGSSVPAVRGTTQSFCFSVATGDGEILLHARSHLEISATGPVDIADVDANLEISRGLVTLPTARCVQVVARERGAGEITLRFAGVERRIAVDVVEADDVIALEVIDARFRRSLPSVLDVGDDVVAKESSLADVRFSCHAGVELFVRGTLADGRSTLVPVAEAAIVVEPADLARPSAQGPLVSLSSSAAGSGTMTIALGLATKALPLEIDCPANAL